MDELVEQILNMASSGVWRQEIFSSIESSHEAIGKAIRIAKRKGMYTIGSMRDEEKGTYYQFDGVENE